MRNTASNLVGKLLCTLPVNVVIRTRPIDFMEVKDLYDAAFEAKAEARVNLKQFKALLARAERLDAAYRAQIARDATRFYKGKVA